MTLHLRLIPTSRDWAQRIVTDPSRAAVMPRSVREDAWEMLLAARRAALRTTTATDGDAA